MVGLPQALGFNKKKKIWGCVQAIQITSLPLPPNGGSFTGVCSGLRSTTGRSPRLLAKRCGNWEKKPMAGTARWLRTSFRQDPCPLFGKTRRSAAPFPLFTTARKDESLKTLSTLSTLSRCLDLVQPKPERCCSTYSARISGTLQVKLRSGIIVACRVSQPRTRSWRVESSGRQ